MFAIFGGRGECGRIAEFLCRAKNKNKGKKFIKMGENQYVLL